MAVASLAKPALDRRTPVLFLTVALGVGLLFILAYNLVVDGPARLAGLVPLFQHADWRDWASVLFLGWACTVFGYIYWMWALQDSPVSIMAITLYVQPVLGVVWGYFLTREAVTVSTFTGGALIVTAVWLGSRPRRG